MSQRHIVRFNMKTLKNIKKAPFEIGQLLASNSHFCALLTDDSDNPTTVTTTFEDLLNKEYITIYPPVNNGEIDDYTRNTYCVILLDNISTNTDILSGSGNLYVITNRSHVLLDGNKNRLLELSDEVFQTLEGAKITSAGELHITHITHVMIDNFNAGYRINFTFSDLQSRKAEI